ncbi:MULTISPECIES: gas vesicle protein [Nocardia]|uniref:gas vesicle protein n=1 Tax=Nocardia TaxID=1817 RepID=UPI000BF1D3C6|nr:MULTISPECIES: gas vesicle protein [Nocardia]MBF6184095.1 gas vesicle protein [Nocardia farcinica]MBF6293039.1 gas vesicle protein [Nocardia farcinica]MBF6309938.1 gas vesicle protein [Nocardia farcinica]MBF6358936.1 gas vesicle protein [Nocardia farcinica]MBF6379334.1 gas vesicle protein [Nocardia farcinica]
MTYPDRERRVALIDLLDRVLAGGVVISGDIRLSIADVDLVQISLRALISSISALTPAELDTVGGEVSLHD